MKRHMPPSLIGPRLAPRSGTARQLVVFLHGYGADGNDLIEIGRQWQRWLPDAAFVSPNAPEACAGAPMGRQWFALTFRDPHERWRGVKQAGPGLDAFLDAELAQQGLDASKLALVGFSQGTMMALHVGLRRQRAPAAILGYSGMVVIEEGKGAEALKADIRAKPPILLVHGDRDDVIPLEALFLSTEALASSDVPCQWHLSLGIGHGIDAEALRHGGLFLAHAFGLPYPK
jgi:phospholipase/carboxylesterase